MTLDEVSAIFRKMEGARDWTSYQGMVMWGFSSDPDANMTFVFKGAHVCCIMFDESDTSGKKYTTVESRLNRHLVALNDHEWIDKTNQSKWNLTAKDGKVSVMVYKPGTFRE